MKRIYVNYSEHQYFTTWESANKYYNILASNEKEFLQKWVTNRDTGYQDIDNKTNIIYIDWESWQIFESFYELLADDFSDNYFTTKEMESLISIILACNGDNDKLLQRLYETTRIQKVIIE